MIEATCTIGRRIRAVRHRAGLSLDNFAAAIGVSRRALVNWEQNNAAPSIGVLATLRRLFDVDPEWIISGDNDTPTSRYVKPDWGRLDRLEAEVAEICAGAGVEADSVRRQQLARMLYDDGTDAEQATSKQLQKILIVMSRPTADRDAPPEACTRAIVR